jgi:hypothetical protein
VCARRKVCDRLLISWRGSGCVRIDACWLAQAGAGRRQAVRRRGPHPTMYSLPRALSIFASFSRVFSSSTSCGASDRDKRLGSCLSLGLAVGAHCRGACLPAGWRRCRLGRGRPAHLSNDAVLLLL